MLILTPVEICCLRNVAIRNDLTGLHQSLVKIMLCFGAEWVFSRQRYNCALQGPPKRCPLLIVFTNLYINLAFRLGFGLLLAVEIILFQHTTSMKPKVDP